MALTPEDVVNKHFQQTKFREGYDQDEVDDFLDEVVVELRRLTEENADLTARLKAAESGANSAPVAAAPVAAVPTPVAAVAPAPVAAAPADDAESSASLLQLARRLHDEHVKEGVDKRDSLISEGNATASRIVAEAESKQRAQTEIFEKQKQILETKIDELRVFERDYRKQLRGFIETQLSELDDSAQAASTK